VEASLENYKEKMSSHSIACQALSPGKLGKRGKPAEEVADEVCRDFIHFEKTEATVDTHLADQIILYMALAHGDSIFITPEITSHLTTNIDIIKRFIPTGIELDNTSGQVRISGARVTPGF
jgi:RNA 3'-terminal phosphate cyclase